ncbi:ribosome-binding factor A [Rubellimicrobium thermophilum DSM 16684]|uniref:Ribosome-binding factor A n=1 Tax=Rubellimicrobium thermophilum DSM 16684 TaxID=1123069 RepID=S9S8G4_9RHOB|nr:30S ribosome-binding factor RbfA [Rubellimicrobium thermophilum]EPX82534.1 ribosome-binding factor A [Rubellimicrobium thermophilum DSM 16684]
MSAPSQRQLRVGELIRRALSEILAEGDIHDPALAGRSITVGEVRVSPDLRQATAHVLPLGGEGTEAAIAALRRHKGEIRRRLASRVELRHVPDLRFAMDESFDRLDAARRLFADPRIRRDVAEDPEA